MNADDLKDFPQGRILAIDYGQKRIGLAICDPSQTIASSLCTLYRRGDEVPLDAMVRIIAEQEVVGVVVGNPVHMNGREGERSVQVAGFIDRLLQMVDRPIICWDERWTTRSAHKSLHERGKRPSENRDHIDQIAAAFLLQSFLDRLHVVRGQT